LIFASRGSGAPDSGFQWKVRIFFLGAILALAGIGTDSSYLVGSALVVLVGGMALAFFWGRTSAPEEDGPEEDGNSSVSRGLEAQNDNR